MIKRGVNATLERWREALESKSLNISRTKAEYMDCNFNGHIERTEIIVRIEYQEMPQSNYFHYLGSIISKDGEIDENVEHRIKAGWLKWRLAFGAVTDECQQD
eukprot:TRINITY_DN17929_c0_g2_i1.p1 TRINITY_DN17929_c0_g2~~TRINITY_DN17929_c0_g2_i1.p1  ORF type:complete len:103 (-),score=14.21 TRINITY_DN17929_c0_g2_i1:4-312(-)